MTNIDKIVNEFETRLTILLNEIECEKTKAKRMNGELIKSCNSEQPNIDNQKTQVRAGICLFINSEKDAKKVHKRIKKLIKAKKYPITESEWYYSNNLDVWQFDFTV